MELDTGPIKYQAHDVDQLSDFLRAFGWQVRFDTSARACNYKSESLFIPSAVVMRFDIKTALTASTAGQDDVLIFHVTDAGGFSFEINNDELSAGPGRGMIVPVREARSGSNTDQSQGMGIAISRLTLMATLRDHFEIRVQRDLEFKRILLDETHAIRGLKALGEALLSCQHTTTTKAKLADGIACYMLETFPNNYWDQINGVVPSLAPHTLLKAKTLIEDSLQEGHTIADIANSVGVSIRALQYSFMQHCSTTPIRYQQLMRLKRACEELKAAPDHLSTTDIARKWGFTNFGRFSKFCHEVYGCRPRQLRRGGQ